MNLKRYLRRPCVPYLLGVAAVLLVIFFLFGCIQPNSDQVNLNVKSYLTVCKKLDTLTNPARLMLADAPYIEIKRVEDDPMAIRIGGISYLGDTDYFSSTCNVTLLEMK